MHLVAIRLIAISFTTFSFDNPVQGTSANQRANFTGSKTGVAWLHL